MKLKNTYTILLPFITAMILLVPYQLIAQQENLVTISAMVTDDGGNPVANAEIFSGSAFTRSDASGKFTIDAVAGSDLIVEAAGFGKISLSFDEAANTEEIRLKRSKLFYGSDARIQLAFRKSEQGDLAGAVSQINAADIAKYDYQTWASGVLNGRTLGMMGSNNIRGIGISIDVADLTGSGTFSGNALFIVDGLPREIESLRMADIETVTVLKDVNAAVLYGSAAINGVVLITTKRGEAFKKRTDLSVNYGISVPLNEPDFLNSADYMTWFNKARENDGLEPMYDDQTIKNYRTGNKYRYPDVDYYSDEYLKPFRSYFDLLGEFSGGNDVARYYMNTGWYSSGGLLDFGEGKNARNNRFNVRGNIDLKINDWINTSIDGTAVFLNNRSQQGNYWSSAATIRPYEYTPLLPFELIDPENPLLKGRKNDVQGKYLLGGNASFLSNPIGDGYAAGIFELIYRNFSFNNRINFDLNKITQGLSAHTNISFDYYTAYTQTIDNDYSVYEPTWSDTEDKIIALTQHGKDARPGTQVVGGTAFRRRFGFFGQLSYDRIFNDVHHLTGNLLAYGSSFKEGGDFQGVKHAHAGFQASYIYNRKYMADFSAAYVNSVKLADGNRGGFSPSAAVGWTISEEDFLSSSKFINHLKLRLSGGILQSDLPIGSFFYYDNRYAGSGSYNWYEGTRSRSGVASSWGDNRDLTFAKRKEINLGIEGLLFNSLLGFEANVFYDVYDDLVTRPNATYPSFYNDFLPYENFESDRYEGVEAGLTLNKTVGDWSFFAGVNVLYVTSERTKVNEIWKNDYQYRKGHPKDATFGLEALGLFQDQAEIEGSPKQTFGTVRPGDIKYKDQNGDDLIDANDEVYLRRWQAPFSGGIQLRMSYKNLTLYVLGEGRSGSKTFMEGNYYWVDGNDKYSEVVLGSWTPETRNAATYPRLSSQANSNNARRSSYWLYNNDYLQIQKVQLTYGMPQPVIKALKMKEFDIYIDASDVWQFAKNRKIRETRVGSEPYYRTFSIGVKANF